MNVFSKLFILLFSATIFSCDDKPNLITPENAEEVVINCNATVQKSNIILLGERGYFEDDPNSLKEYSYVKRLEKESYATVDSIETKTTAGRTPKVVTVYNITLTEKAKTFILKATESQATVKTFETRFKSLRMLDFTSETKTTATVRYEKTKTPFYEKTFDKSLLKNTPDLFTKVIYLVKNEDRVWSAL